MKNKFLKFSIVLIMCLVILSGCSVVPSSTPETTPTPVATPTPEPTPEPTPAPWLVTFKKYKTKMEIHGDFPSSFYYLTAGQNVIISLRLNGENFFDRESYEKETEGLYWDTDREKLNKIHSKYVKLAVTDFLKKYNLEDQMDDKDSFSGVEMKYTTLDVAEKIISDPDVVYFAMMPLDKNGNGIPHLLFKENSRLPISYPYEYDEDWNLIYPKGPVYNSAGNMVYDENGKRVVSSN